VGRRKRSISWVSGLFRRADRTTAERRGSEQPVVAGDNPIRALKDDTLGRGTAARSFAQQVLRLDACEGVVVAVLGAWGSGKTSFINLARSEFENAGVPILDFNPWMFSGAQQLFESFFAELAAQLRLRPGLAEIGKDLEEYGETLSGFAWVPVVGPWIDRVRMAAKILTKALQRRKGGIGERRSKLKNALTALAKPILVVLDDIDRLSASEIRDVFKLVRLTASFPNIIYILAFDRGRVEKALVDEGIPGRDYLEKILQVAIDLPAIPAQVLNQQIFAAMDASLDAIENRGPLDQGCGLTSLWRSSGR
jgi:predicted KAP-like P-loop ATPase